MNPPYDIVMFNMSSFQEWESGIVNRNFHVLRHMLNRPEVGRVLAVDYMPFNLKRGLKSYLESQAFGVKGKTIYRDMTNRLVQVDESRIGRHAGKLFVYSTVDTIVSENFALRGIRRAIKKLGFQRPVLWSYTPIFVEPFRNLDVRLRVFDAVDDWRNHSAYEKQREKLEQNYKIIGRKADVIFTVAEDLQLLFSEHGQAHWIPNGVDFDRWQGQFDFPDDMRSIPAPVVGYAGVIQDRVDVKLIHHLAENNPEKSFVFVGMVWPEISKGQFSNTKNVHFLGQKTYDDLPKYISHFHVGIIPHKVDPFTQSMNPLKLYEYLACGLPVVSTPVAGMEMFEDCVKIATDPEYFSEQIDSALDSDTPEQRLRRRRAVKPHSWDSRIEKMLELIKQQPQSV